MARKSSVDRLPRELQVRIAQLYQKHTLDEIMAHLATMGGDAATVSRSAVHRWVSKGDEELAEDLRKARVGGAYLAEMLDDAPHSSAARLNVELLHDQVFGLLRKARETQRQLDRGEIEEAKVPDAKGLMALARTIESLTRASRHDLEFIKAAETRAAEKATKAAASTAAEAAKARGMSSETAEFIKAMVLGVKPA
jgi:hypothetical protein